MTITMVLEMILMKMMTTILMRRRHQVFFVIFVHYSFLKKYYCHLDVLKFDFPLDEKIKKVDSDEDDEDDEDDDDHSHSHSHAKKTPGILLYLFIMRLY